MPASRTRSRATATVTKAPAKPRQRKAAPEPRVLIADKQGNVLSIAVPQSVALRDYPEHTVVSLENGQPLPEAQGAKEAGTDGATSGRAE
jgi:hypothetical protein